MMRGFLFLAFAVLVCLAALPARASAIEKWSLNGPSEDPPVPADRGVILGSVEKTVKVLGLISRPLQIQFALKEPIAGLTSPDGMPKFRFHFDYDDHELAS